MKKILFIIVGLLSFPLSAESDKNIELKKASKKIEKRQDYCSPLDRLTKKCKTDDDNSDKVILEKTQKKGKEISKKIEKSKDYCSPLDKMMNRCKSKVKAKD